MKTNETYVTGFDGGGSTARFAIATMAGEIIFRHKGRGVNSSDNSEWQAEYEKLFAQAAPYLQAVKAACFGIPGWGEIAQQDRLVLSFLHHHLHCPITIMNDVELAHYAAFNDETGILILSGTGSMAIARDHSQNFIRAGGFGHLIGDEGSAYWIGQQALIRLAREIDGRAPKSSFGDALSKRLNCALTLTGLMEWMERDKHARSHIASVAAIIDEMAELGDAVAQDLLIAAARELFMAWQAVNDQLGHGRQKYPWAMAGSCFCSKLIGRTLRDLIGYAHQNPVQSAVDKAVRMALHNSERQQS